jgi:hypothetical protein
MAKTKSSKRTNKTRGFWTPEEIKKLKKLFRSNPTSEIAGELGRNTDAVKKKASRMGLKKSKTYMKSLGRA